MTEICPICLVEPHPLHQVTTVCSHTFHTSCLDQWATQQSINRRGNLESIVCPICRSNSTFFIKSYTVEGKTVDVLILQDYYNNWNVICSKTDTTLYYKNAHTASMYQNKLGRVYCPVLNLHWTENYQKREENQPSFNN